jgi:hypothetical protein
MMGTSTRGSASRWRRAPARTVLGLVAAIVLVLADGCTPSAAPSPTVTLNAFLSHFFHGQVQAAAALTTGGNGQADAFLAGARTSLAPLVVNRPPFKPLSAMRWTSRCNGLQCTVDFADLNGHAFPPLTLHLAVVRGQDRVPLSDFMAWVEEIGNS